MDRVDRLSIMQTNHGADNDQRSYLQALRLV
jgi:hypothetical protein